MEADGDLAGIAGNDKLGPLSTVPGEGGGQQDEDHTPGLRPARALGPFPGAHFSPLTST